MKKCHLLFLLVLCFSFRLHANAIPQPSDAAIVHLLNRIGYGPRPHDIEKVKKMGIKAYMDQQLHPETIPIPQALQDKLNALPTLSLDTLRLMNLYGKKKGQPIDPKRPPRLVLKEATEARIMRALESPQQLQEVMVDFWFNHFNISYQKGLPDILWVGVYERDAIRPYALGHFYDLLLATAKHPAMLFYLDNWENRYTKKKPEVNENYAREVMELHTLGVDGGYTQSDVEALAHILSGWTYLVPGAEDQAPYRFLFDPLYHDSTPQKLLGRDFNGVGIEEGENALKMLSQHPSTAHHIAYQLAQYFVEDTPKKELVDQLAAVFSKTDGDIRAVMEALLTSSHFWDPAVYGKKFKTPDQYVLSLARVRDVEINDYRPLSSRMDQMGMPLYGHLTPDGYKNTEDAWLSPDGLLNRIAYATSLAKSQLPIVVGSNEEKTKKYPQAKPEEILSTMGSQFFTESTLKTVKEAPENLRATLLLGSPEMMRH